MLRLSCFFGRDRGQLFNANIATDRNPIDGGAVHNMQDMKAGSVESGQPAGLHERRVRSGGEIHGDEDGLEGVHTQNLR